MQTAAALWVPDAERVKNTQIMAFLAEANHRFGLALKTYDDLHAWSVERRNDFWSMIWDMGDIIGERGERICLNADTMPGAAFFPDARLNFAENLLRRNDDTPALIFRGEDKAESRMSWRELHALVSRLQQLFIALGIRQGDRIAAMVPNRPETIAVMLAASSLGAIFSSCSPDFGEKGVLDRFSQIEPRLFIAVDGYWYAGKRLNIAEKLAGIIPHLPTVARTLVMDYLGDAPQVAASLPQATALDEALAPFAPGPLTFKRLPFNAPLYILFSSGTTGVPKCIVHGAGGTLLQHIKEHRLHCDLRAGDRFFYFTTCGWMMWNWLASGLASGLTLMLYDGSPFHPAPSVIFDYAAQEHFTMLGTSAKYIDACRKAGLSPKTGHDLSALKVMTSTGSPLAPEGFQWVYGAVKTDLHLASVSGGTDIVSCFVLGDPTSAVHKGEIQVAGLGMAVDVWDDEGRPVRGQKGELVCTRPFPSMPVMFWNDPDGTKYHDAYFGRFANVWCHGDFAEWTQNGGLIIHGRSDATLNPGGVRIGTAEIYAQVERIAEVVEAIAIGQDHDNDVRVVLFVRLRDGMLLDEALKKRIAAEIRAGASPRHVPARIIQVTDIPRTRSGKITELAVRDVVHGRTVKNTEALANPESLDLFCDLPELRS